MQKLLVSPSPHVHTALNTRRLMMDVIIALLPVTILSVIFYGWHELMVIFVSVASCALLEWAITKYILKKPSTIGDLSAVVTGLLLALNLSSLTPWWVVLIGAVIAIGVAKMSFGGLGQNVFNPALVARVFLLISFPVYMTTWAMVDPGNIGSAWSFGTDAITGSTALTLMKETHNIDSSVILQAGSAGEIYDWALILGFLYLIIRKVIKPWITLSIWATVLVFYAILYFACPGEYLAPGLALFTGGILLGSIFMATDYVTSPMTNVGGVIFGVGIGLITVIIRNWGAYPEGVSFAILIMNAFVPLIDKACKSKKFGRA